MKPYTKSFELNEPSGGPNVGFESVWQHSSRVYNREESHGEKKASHGLEKRKKQDVTLKSIVPIYHVRPFPIIKHLNKFIL